VSEADGFLARTLPFIWDEALRAGQALPDHPLLDSAGSLEFTQRECLGILANAFLCTFTDRPSANCLSGEDLPSINFDELYGGPGWGPVEVAKLHMLFGYFEEMRRRHRDGDELLRPVRFIRQSAAESTAADWEGCGASLIEPVVHDLGQSIDDARGMLRVDFANRLVGGAAIAYGCVQEEIMFCVSPELIVSRVYCPAMKPDEAIVIIGAEQFSIATGYAGSLRYGGTFSDPTPRRDDGLLGSHIVAIDAIDFRHLAAERQYEPDCILRELTKAWAGFSVSGTPLEIATGNWGCGVFGGDALLKSILQWLAAGRAGKILHYFPFDHEQVHREFPVRARAWMASGATVGEVVGGLIPGP